MLTAQTHDALLSLVDNIKTSAHQRNGVLNGNCAVSLTDSDTSIDFDVAAGDVQIDGNATSVSAQTVTLPDGEQSWPRYDVIYIDSNGNAQVEPGEPQSYEPARDTDGDFENELAARRIYKPTPDDMQEVLLGPDAEANEYAPTGVVLAAVIVPPRATAATDLNDGEAKDWVDLRLTVAPTSGAGDHSNLTNVQPDQHHTPPDDQDFIDANAPILDTARTFLAPPTTVPADDEVLIGYLDTPSGVTVTLGEAQVYTDAGNAPSALELVVEGESDNTLYSTGLLRDTSPTAISGGSTLKILLRNTNGSGGADASGGAHLTVRFT